MEWIYTGGGQEMGAKGQFYFHLFGKSNAMVCPPVRAIIHLLKAGTRDNHLAFSTVCLPIRKKIHSPFCLPERKIIHSILARFVCLYGR